MGKCLYPGSGTISCPYHGWTYDGTTGRCVAKLMEDPDAVIPPQARVKSYPVREFAGCIWLFVGDMEPVALEEDLPEQLARQSEWHTIWNWRTYRCDWRLLSDNLAHDQHAPFLHRTSPELLLQPIFRHATRNFAIPLADGRSIGHRTQGGVSEAEYPGLGRFPPRQEWYRVLKPTGRGVEIDPVNSPAARKYGITFRHISMLPSIHLIGRPSGDFFTCRWIVPVDARRRCSTTSTCSGGAAGCAWRPTGSSGSCGSHGRTTGCSRTRTSGWWKASRPARKCSRARTSAWRRFTVAHARRPAADAASRREPTGSADSAAA